MRYKKGDKVVLKRSKDIIPVLQKRFEELNYIVTIWSDHGADYEEGSEYLKNCEYMMKEVRGYHCLHTDIEGLYVPPLEPEPIHSRCEILDIRNE